MTLPRGVRQTDFDNAISRWRGIVGEEWVFTGDADVALYRDAYSPLWNEPDEKVA